MGYSHHQKRVAYHIYSVGRKKGASRKELLSALETALTESNLGNPNYGDGTSKGWRQQISGAGVKSRNRLNVRKQAGYYFDETRAAGRGRGKSAGQLAQAVQRSAFPGRYDQHSKQAKDLLNWLERKHGAAAPGGEGRTVTKTVTPGVDNSGMRRDLKLAYLEQRGRPDALLTLAAGLKNAGDVAPVTKTVTTGGGTRGGRGSIPIVDRALRAGEKWSKAKVPYLWGGGHGRTAKAGQPVDCSGFVSAAVGLKTPQVSGWFAKHYGKPGVGKHLTVWANDGHVLMSVRDPRTGKVRWFGTSRSNPGGGAGEIPAPSKSYLRNFTPRHPGKRK